MSISILKLHLAQAGKSLNRARNNNYSDQEKQQYQEKLIELYERILECVAIEVNPSDSFILEIKQTLDFIYKSLEFLDSSTLNLIPFETVEGLKLALRDWTNPNDNYIIVTSLINEIDGFSFDNSLVEVDKRYSLFKTKYNVDFTSRLVQINIPRALSRDYLASVVHYHELGHFIDSKYAITNSLSRTIFDQWNELEVDDPVKYDFLDYFPFLDDLNFTDTDKFHTLFFHVGEYFCDLFASQYVGDSLNMYLMYITENQSTYSETHPASTSRSLVVRDFLNGSSNIIIENTNLALHSILSKKLAILYDKPLADDLYNFLPPIVLNEKQLHGLLSLGWDIWQSDWTPFRENMHMQSNPAPERIYTVINNLIEKSIGNYIVENKWKASHP